MVYAWERDLGEVFDSRSAIGMVGDEAGPATVLALLTRVARPIPII